MEQLLYEAKLELQRQIKEEKQLQEVAREFGEEYELRVEAYRARENELER